MEINVLYGNCFNWLIGLIQSVSVVAAGSRHTIPDVLSRIALTVNSVDLYSGNISLIPQL